DGTRAGAWPVPHRRLERRARAARDPRPRARRRHRRAADGTTRRRGASVVSRQPRAVRDDRAAPWRRAARSRDIAPARGARRSVDGPRLACDDGERGPQRSPRGSAHIEHVIRQNPTMAVTEKLTRLDCAVLDRAIDRGTKRLLELQRPNGVWVGELESN